MKLPVRERAPGFTLPSHLGVDISLNQYSDKFVVIAFFPLAWTPV